MNKVRACGGVALMALLVVAGAAEAATTSYAGSIPMTGTNWSNSLSIPRFDPSLGTLNSVSWNLSGNVNGTARFESFDASPTVVNMTLSADLKLFAPDSSLIQLTVPSVNTTDNATAYDGTFDWGGTSGNTYGSLAGGSIGSGSNSSPAFLAFFIGLGNVTLPVTAQGTSTGNGGGNLITQFITSADATGEIIYDYTPVPAPGAIALMGIAGVVAGRRRR